MDWSTASLQSLNTAGVLMLAFGIAMRRRAKIHIPVMLAAFVVDLFTVFMIELQTRSEGKGAVEQGIESFTDTEGSTIGQFHIITSTLFLVGYVIAMITGFVLCKKGLGRKPHRVNAYFFVLTRLASYVSSFWMGG